MKFRTTFNNNSIDVYFNKTNNYKINSLNINFIDSDNKYSNATYALLGMMLTKSSQNLKESDIKHKLDSLYGSTLFFTASKENNCQIFSAVFYFINASFATNLVKDLFDLFFELLLKPKSKNGKLDLKYFKECKEILYNVKLDTLKNKNAKAFDDFVEILNKNANYSGNNYTLNDVNKITYEDCNNCYRDLLKKHILINGCGNIDFKIVKNIFKNRFNNQESFNYQPYIDFDYNGENKIVKIDESFNQSVILKVYKYDNKYNIDDKTSSLFNYIYGGTNGRLFNIIREEYGLCYNISALFNVRTENLLLVVNCLNKDISKCIEISDTILNSLGKDLVSDLEYKNALNYFIDSYKYLDESQERMNNFMLRQYLNNTFKSNKQLIDEGKKVTKEDIKLLSTCFSEKITYILSDKEYD